VRVSGQRRVSTQLKLTSTTTTSRRPSQSSISGAEDSTTTTTALNTSTLNGHLSQLNSRPTGLDRRASKSRDKTARRTAAVGQQSATEERSRGQASQNKTTLQIATHNVRGTAKPQTTTETRTKQSLALHQKTTPSMLGRSSSTSVTRPKQAANSKLQRTVNSSCNDEVTIAFHKPTVTVSTQSASNNNNN